MAPWCTDKFSSDASPSHFIVQVTWSKSMTAVSRFVMTMGDRAMNIIKKLEDNESRPLSGYSFKALESVTMEEDFEKIINRSELEKKLNTGGFQNIVKKVVRERWWIWCLQHPGLRPDKIHPSRGVSLLEPSHFKCLTGLRHDNALS
jgi:hypothetical protein